jgi:hypothetical protein
MANQWLRLWHDMPTDPKWRTIAKISNQRIGDVIAVYVHLLVCASNANERGRTQSFNCEDVGSSLDLNCENVALIIDAMNGRVLDEGRLKGWDLRQVVREDGSSERAKAWRNAKKDIKNAGERNRTLDKDTDKDKKEEKKKEDDFCFNRFFDAYPKKVAKPAAVKAFKKISEKDLQKIMAHVEMSKASPEWTKEKGKYIPYPATYLNQRRWEDLNTNINDDPFDLRSAL